MTRHVILNFLFAASMLALYSCNLLATRDDLQEWERNHDKWVTAGLDHYSYETRRGCFCAPELSEWMQVEVLAGSIVAVLQADSGEPPEQVDSTYFDTMDEIFHWTRDLIRDADEYSLSYDPTLGYPTDIEYDYNVNATDDDGFFRVRSVLQL